MTDAIPLTGLKREAEKISGTPIDANYRKIYTMALNGEIPAEQINGRWHVKPSNIPIIVGILTARQRAA